MTRQTATRRSGERYIGCTCNAPYESECNKATGEKENYYCTQRGERNDCENQSTTLTVNNCVQRSQMLTKQHYPQSAKELSAATPARADQTRAALTHNMLTQLLPLRDHSSAGRYQNADLLCGGCYVLLVYPA